ncbi:hypothetical protein BT96DRAFT_1018971 [Gymnopus androsaceus JB14]|uniref:Uncharacterized protein n=1 Tax=Gymnopus androsaceus JB14 TaxID=1447944 RepID=A0A6A4HUD5_9AGAR|nr:hypothetical protein BT96DRAFT_1018971 [Gymnopus androsaceus JB14]
MGDFFTPDTALPRLIIVDDTDPLIHYSPSEAFTTDLTGKLDGQGVGGPVYNHSITGTTTSSSLSYKFNGTFVRAVIAVEDPSNAAGWNCTVDSHLINNALITFNGLVTGIVACDSGLTLAGMFDEHTLEMNFEFSESAEGANGATSTIWLDSIQYQPLPSDPLDGVMLRVHNSDPFVTYDNNTGHG